MRGTTYIILITLLLLQPLLGKVPEEILDQRRDRTVTAIRLNGESVKLDGKLDESFWAHAERAGDFTQRDPVDGDEASYQTVFSLAYDDENLYTGVRAYDEDPEDIVAILTRRDEYTPSDWIYISIDSYNDNRTAFEFGLSAAGVKHDLRRYDDSNADWDWDAVWEGAVHIDDYGWTAEFQIPFHELRFSDQEEREWGFNIYREFPRNDNELSIWSYWSKDETGFVSNYGTLIGLDDLNASQPLYVQPYMVGRSAFTDDLAPFKSDLKEELDNGLDIGADVRKSFENGLTLNATINPDFGQVEADPAEFNLTEFESFFREKRPFFLEGGNILNYSLGFGDGDQSSNTLFYSRRIGRAPQGYAETDSDYVSIDSPDQTSILAATKLTGKLQNGMSVGIMSAITPEEHARINFVSGAREEQVIEPLSSYFLARLQQDYRDGGTTVGGILTATNRKLEDTGMEYLRSGAYTGGLDVHHRFFDDNYELFGSLAFSHVEGSTDAILGTQRHPSRYFQRIDADYLSVDSSATTLDGWAGKFIIGKGGGNVQAYGGLLATSPGFEVNDLGFLRSVDNINEFIWIGIRQWEPGPFYLNYSLNFNQWANWTFGSEFKGIGGNVNGYLRFKNNWGLGGGLNYNSSGLNTFHLRGGPAIATGENYNMWIRGHSDQRKSLNISGFGHAFYNTDDVSGWGMQPSIEWRPKHNIKFNVGPNYRYFKDSWAWVAQMKDTQGEDHYIFSGLEQDNLSLTLRADLTLTTDLSLQYYAQTFLTGGTYFDYIEVADSYSKDFDKRFDSLSEEDMVHNEDGDLDGFDLDSDGILDYETDSYVYSDFNYKQLSSNLVLRWEYRTGSTIYFVWSSGAVDWVNDGHFNVRNDVNTLFDVTGDNVLLIKINSLLNI